MPLALLVLALVLITHLVNFGAGDHGIALLDANDEWSYSHILATTAFGGGAAVCWAGARAGGQRAASWWVACALFAFLFVDGLTRLHEHVAFWPAVYAPILLALSVCAYRVSRGTASAGAVTLALGLLAVSIAIHVLGPRAVDLLGWDESSWGYQVKVGLKEGTELAGWVLLVPWLAIATRARTSRAPAADAIRA
jgi:hypothetical protein